MNYPGPSGIIDCIIVLGGYESLLAAVPRLQRVVPALINVDSSDL